jgi:complex iron-sulfur molybdoenzyme family reductase subunit alpha
LLRKLDLFVKYDVRMSSTAAYADYVLPGAFYYERPDAVSSPNFAVVTAMSEAIPPPGEAKTYWQYFRELSKKISERAQARDFPEYIDEAFTDESGKPVIRDLANLHRDFTANGELETDEQVVGAFLAASPATKDWTYKELAERGFAYPQVGAPDFVAGEAYTPYRPQVEKKVPYPTYSGRQTYYVDHEWFIELGEEIPTHKPPLSNDKYPIFFNSGHTRVGVHSTFRTNVWMQRLQRGGPYVYLSPVDMRRRGIADGDMVRIYNNVGETECMAKIDPGLPEGMLYQYHGFEPYQFKDWNSKQAVLVTAINPLELVNGWGHLKAPHEPREKKGFTMAPNCKTHDVTVEVEKI